MFFRHTLGMMVAAMMTVPVMAGNISSGSPQCHFE